MSKITHIDEAPTLEKSSGGALITEPSGNECRQCWMSVADMSIYHRRIGRFLDEHRAEQAEKVVGIEH